MRPFALAPALALALALVGCTSAPAPDVAADELPVRFVHTFETPVPPDRFRVPDDAGTLHVVVKLENFRRGQCPGPVATLVVRAPGGAEHVRFVTPDAPTEDCELVHEKDEALAAGVWTVEYSGGSGAVGSIVDVRRASAEP